MAPVARRDVLLRDQATRRVRVMTALAGAGSVAGTGGVLVVIAGTGFAASPSSAPVAAPHATVGRHVPQSLLATRRPLHRHRTSVGRAHRRKHLTATPQVHAAPTAAAGRTVAGTRPAAKHPAKPGRTAAPRPASTPPSPAPSSSGSGGSSAQSGGSH